MLSLSSNPFLNDLEAEKHQFLIEKGNLPEAKKLLSSPRSSPIWSDENSWKSLGYEAHIQIFLCACETITSILTGVYHVETTPSGKRRSLALSPKAQWPLTGNYPKIETILEVPHCAHCITSKGFTK